MSNIDDSDLDLNNDIDECTHIRVQPSPQPSVLYSNFEKEKFRKIKEKSQCLDAERTIASGRNSNNSKTSLLFEEFEKEKILKIKPKILDLDKRMQNFSNKKIEKVKGLAKEKEENESKQCTFKPMILNKNKTKGIFTFLKQIQKFTQAKNSKIQMKIEEKQKSEEVCEKKSIINKKSLKILSKNSRSPSRNCKETLQNFSFQPKINEISKNMPRTGSVYNKLYSAAKKSPENRSPSNFETKNYTSPKSEQLLVKKFESEFYKIISELDFDSSGLINYSKFCKVFSKMLFFSCDGNNAERELLVKA